jgi:hypothetical protein
MQLASLASCSSYENLNVPRIYTIDLSASYFSNMKQILSINNYTTEKKSKRAVHRDLVVGRAFGMLCIIHF